MQLGTKRIFLCPQRIELVQDVIQLSEVVVKWAFPCLPELSQMMRREAAPKMPDTGVLEPQNMKNLIGMAQSKEPRGKNLFAGMNFDTIFSSSFAQSLYLLLTNPLV